MSDPSDTHLPSTYSMTSLIVQSIYGWAPILNARSLWTLNMLCSGLFNSRWCWASTAREARYSSYSPLSRVSCTRVCVTEMGGGGHVLCRALRNTCSLADSAQHYSNSTKHSLADALINDACSPCLTLWCFHVTAWGRGMLQVKKTMTMLPSLFSRWHLTLYPHSGSG